MYDTYKMQTNRSVMAETIALRKPAIREMSPMMPLPMALKILPKTVALHRGCRIGR